MKGTLYDSLLNNTFEEVMILFSDSALQYYFDRLSNE